MNTNRATTKAYDKIAPRYSKIHFDPFWVKEFAFFRRNVFGKKVLDIGCGAGRDAPVFLKHGFDYLGIDGSRGMVKVARARTKRAKFKLMDFYKLRSPPHSFDGIWAVASLVHIPKKRMVRALQGIKRILKPDGIGFIVMREKKGISEGFFPYAKNPGTYRYWSFYTKTEFAHVLNRSGFRVVKFMKHPEKEPDGSVTMWLCFFVRNARQ